MAWPEGDGDGSGVPDATGARRGPPTNLTFRKDVFLGLAADHDVRYFDA